MLSPASPPGPALGPALREGLKLGPGPSPTFKARARPELVFLGPDPSLIFARSLWEEKFGKCNQGLRMIPSGLLP